MGLEALIGVLNGQYKNTRPEILGAQLINELIKGHEINSVDGIFVVMQLVQVEILDD